MASALRLVACFALCFAVAVAGALAGDTNVVRLPSEAHLDPPT